MPSILSVITVFAVLFILFWCVRKFIPKAAMRAVVVAVVIAIAFLFYAMEKLWAGGVIKF